MPKLGKRLLFWWYSRSFRLSANGLNLEKSMQGFLHWPVQRVSRPPSNLCVFSPLTHEQRVLRPTPPSNLCIFSTNHPWTGYNSHPLASSRHWKVQRSCQESPVHEQEGNTQRWFCNIRDFPSKGTLVCHCASPMWNSHSWWKVCATLHTTPSTKSHFLSNCQFQSNPMILRFGQNYGQKWEVRMKTLHRGKTNKGPN
jgi:hypothetical protein